MSSLEDNSVLSLDAPENAIIILRSETGTVFTLPKSYALISDFLKNALESDKDAGEADLAINDYNLKLIVDYMNEYKGTEPKAPEAPLWQDYDKVVDPFCFNFTKAICEDKKMKDFMNAVNYMAIPQLLLICGCKIASLVKGRDIADIKTILQTEC